MPRFPKPAGLSDRRALAVPLFDLKNNLRIQHSDEDAFLISLIKTATYEAETFMGTAVIERSFALVLDGFPDSDAAIELVNPPIRSITSITYYDAAGDQQTLDAADYALVTALAVPEIQTISGSGWPSTQSRPDAVTVTYLAGFADRASSVPPSIAYAITLRASSRYAVSEEAGTGTVAWKIDDAFSFQNLLMPYRSTFV